MTDEIKKINVRIGGINYQLVSAEDEQYTRQIATRADEMIRRVMQSNPQLSQNMSSILALINSLDELYRVRQQFTGLDGQRQVHDNQLSEIRSELARLREQNSDLKKETLRLANQCRDYEAALAKVAQTSPETTVKPVRIQTPPAAEAKPEVKTEDPITGIHQTNIEDYMRENGWPSPVEPRQYDIDSK